MGDKMKLGQFIIDESAFLDDGQIAIDIEGRGTVYITDNQDGVSIDIYPLWAAEEPILASYLLSEDFEKPLHEYIIHSYEYGAPLTFTCNVADVSRKKDL